MGIFFYFEIWKFKGVSLGQDWQDHQYQTQVDARKAKNGTGKLKEKLNEILKDDNLSVEDFLF